MKLKNFKKLKTEKKKNENWKLKKFEKKGKIMKKIWKKRKNKKLRYFKKNNE